MAEGLNDDVKYAGMYIKRGQDAAHLAENYLSSWGKKNFDEIKKEKGKQKKIYPSICFSRKIGVGALEIADILAKKINYQVVDRKILEHIAENAKLSETTVALYDERYQGKISDLVSFLFGEKSFVASDYSKALFRTIFSIRGLKPTIFVGRGAHLVLPRENTLAVRFISSREHRIKTISDTLNIKEKDAQTALDKFDKDQKKFFSKFFNKKEVSAFDFDLVINCDYIQDPGKAAEIVAIAFKEKFGETGS